MNERPLPWGEFMRSLPPFVSEEAIDHEWFQAVEALNRKIIVLDDDPTGTQTVHSIPVYTSWDADALRKIRREAFRVIYILTNSRALKADTTRDLHRRIARDLADVFIAEGDEILLISRSDSTLRGHYPLETETLYEELSRHTDIHGEILVPFFLEGGRLTCNDVHYVKEDDVLTPAGKTEFAGDAVFGYRSSNLKEWIEEKTGGTYRATDVMAIPLEMLRERNVAGVVKILSDIDGFGKVVVNSVDYSDQRVFVTALSQSLRQGKRFLFRTAASFVQVVGGIRPIPLLKKQALYPDGVSSDPGLVIVGSYVRKTTGQLEALRDLSGITLIEWNVRQAKTDDCLKVESQRVIAEVEEAFARGNDACVYTSREYVSGGRGDEEELIFSQRVSEGLVRVVRDLTVHPGFLVAKGGITSSDVGVKGLAIARAMVMGQIQPGIPVWKLGAESRFPGLPYVVFPGNVGTDDTLKDVVEILRR